MVYTNSSLVYFPMPEGRVVNNSGTLNPEYIITDQQGNARISFNNTGAGGTAKVVQENGYIGFGLALPSTVSGGSNKNLYNGGSEWQNDYNNLPDYYQTFFRNYDAGIGRFVGTDPQPESSESMAPYQYAGNNPILMNDPMGNYIRRIRNAGNAFTYSDLSSLTASAEWQGDGGNGGLGDINNGNDGFVNADQGGTLNLGPVTALNGYFAGF